jgi:alkanesulfonate monooxygenase SsuD/methylene tetrahydromethanopterin reductase-like flavin-dependent oxidoreductase (luciferase family)
MKFYWFGRSNEKDLISFSKDLEDSGFYGVLLPYTVNLGDYFVKVAQCLDPKQKLKYIIAIRPYTISPQYLAMIVKSINEIQNDRLWINFVSGQVSDGESLMGGILGKVTDSSTWQEKKEYLIEYVDVFDNFSKKVGINPTICISGMKEDVFSLVEDYGDYNMVAFEPYMRENGFRKLAKPRIVSMCPFIRDDEKELDALKNDKNLPQDIFPTTTQNLINMIKELKLNNINNVMFFSHGSEEERYRIMQFVKDNKDIFA